MSEIQIALLAIGVAVGGAACVAIVRMRRRHARGAGQTHRPHSPGGGSDRAAAARSAVSGFGSDQSGTNG